MSKKRVKGHKANSILNGEWADHVKKYGKRETAGIRRMEDKKIIRDETMFKEEEPLPMSVLLEMREQRDKDAQQKLLDDYFEDYHNPGYDI